MLACIELSARRLDGQPGSAVRGRLLTAHLQRHLDLVAARARVGVIRRQRQHRLHERLGLGDLASRQFLPGSPQILRDPSLALFFGISGGLACPGLFEQRRHIRRVRTDALDMEQDFDGIHELPGLNRAPCQIQLARHPALLRQPPLFGFRLLAPEALLLLTVAALERDQFGAQRRQRLRNGRMRRCRLLERSDRVPPPARCEYPLLLLDEGGDDLFALLTAAPLFHRRQRLPHQLVRLWVAWIVNEDLACGTKGGGPRLRQRHVDAPLLARDSARIRRSPPEVAARPSKPDPHRAHG